MKNTLITLLALGSLAATASSATYYSQETSINPTMNYVWNEVQDGGPWQQILNPHPPTSGNTDTWVVQSPAGWGKSRFDLTDATWFGGTTVFEGTDNPTRPGMFFQNGGSTGTATLQDAVFDGGAINSNGATMSGNTATITASGVTIGIEGGAGMTVDFDVYTGSGDTTIATIFSGEILAVPGIWNGIVTMAAGTDLSGYTGTFVMNGNQKFAFGGDVTTATFGVEVQSTGVNSYVLQNNVSVTSAKFGGTTLAPGTYNAADLTGLGLGAYFTDNGGTLTVASGAVPEDPKITSISLSGSIATVIMKGTPGVDYYCAGSDDLTTWATEIVPTDTGGSPFQTDGGGDLTFSVDISGLGSRYFLRVQDVDPVP
ncbi:hypothetical protein [Haloferula sp. A504]|uniref:hypothetical protein n=1 Tax=Haloferula sp. A504 TaxID=3373601 RepID=UPI0031C9F8DA|nr:hypothetical protein [Verrucomicrobiaceae bacterium E54]